MSYRELGEIVGLSPTAAAARVDRLIEANVIEGFGARINRRALGDVLHAFVDIKFTQSSCKDEFVEMIETMDQITSAVHITGPFDCAIDAWVSSPEDLADMLANLKSTGNVAEIQTQLVLNSLKESRQPTG